jgi:hypothetical protein
MSAFSVVPFSTNVFAAANAGSAPARYIGNNSGYTLANYQTFVKWFGHTPTYSGLAFNLGVSGASLNASIAMICALGAGMAQQGSKVIWSVPFPAQKCLEKVIAGQFDQLYTAVFKGIVAASPANASTIYVRLPWEFNMTGANWMNAALDAQGAPSPAKFISAWTHLAQLAHSVSARFQRIWCPGTTTRQIDPLSCWPGWQNVEIIAQDFYMVVANVQPSAITWYMNEARGLKWAASFAAAQGKPFALTEFGMDSDVFAGDLALLGLWLEGLGDSLHHACWWDNTSVTNCKISDGSHGALGAQFKKSFA